MGKESANSDPGRPIKSQSKNPIASVPSSSNWERLKEQKDKLFTKKKKIPQNNASLRDSAKQQHHNKEKKTMGMSQPDALTSSTTTTSSSVTKNSGNQQHKPQSINSSTTNQSLTNKSNLSALQTKFAKKLEGARFRQINEQLYTTTGETSFRTFQEDPNLFRIYHEGFREQASHWPQNPLDTIIQWIKKKHPSAVVADMGCGEARLAQSVSNKVHSFDLVSTNKYITAADIAHTPLADGSVDIVVFCLALMGTNIEEFIRETHRVLKDGGILKIAEVRSRFEGEGSSGIKGFMKVLGKAGFDVVQQDASNKMFFFFECVKTSRIPKFEKYTAKACIYKRR